MLNPMKYSKFVQLSTYSFPYFCSYVQKRTKKTLKNNQLYLKITPSTSCNSLIRNISFIFLSSTRQEYIDLQPSNELFLKY